MNDLQDIPATIGKFRILRLLGEGAMGIVYEGLDEAIDRKVAIKTLHDHLVKRKGGDEFLERFKREAKSAARCTHSNIVTILEYGQDGDLPFIAMEFINGYTLQELLQSKKRISLKNILAITSQILQAVHAAHKLGVVHRDIKTANIMISRDSGSVKLADFGIARLNDNDRMTMTGAVVGTPRYMAPEQMFGLKVDERADLFSVAMVLVELLTRLPDHHECVRGRLQQIEGLPPNNQVNYAFSYPQAMISVLEKGLAPKPDERFQSAKEMAAAIRQSVALMKAPVNTPDAAATVINTPATTTAGTQFPAILNEDLDSLTEMLSGYIGPVAKNVLREQSTRFDSMEGLVTAVAQEIPQSEQRQEFLRSWKSQSGQTQAGGQHSRTGLSSHPVARTTTVNMDQNTIQKISQDFVNYIGPFAPRLVDHYAQECSDKEEFLQRLAAEIPDSHSREEFLHRWNLAS